MPAYKCSICSYRFDDGNVHEECPSCGQKDCLTVTEELITPRPPATDEIIIPVVISDEPVPVDNHNELWAQNEEEDEPQE